MFGPNHLVQLIANNEWEKATRVLQTNSSYARKWSVAPSLTGAAVSDILPIHQAASMPMVPVPFLEALLFANPTSIRMRESGTGRIPLHIAIRARCSDEVLIFLMERCPESTRIQDILGRLPLHYACSNNLPMHLIQRLISGCPESSRAVDHMGWTPLHVAAHKSTLVEIVQALVDCCPEAVLLRTFKGNTPVLCAETNKHSDKDLIINVLKVEEEKFHQLPAFLNFKEAELKEKRFPGPRQRGPEGIRFLSVRKRVRSNSLRSVV